MKKALIVGGANGIGLSIANELAQREDTEIITIIDKAEIDQRYSHPKFQYHQFNLQNDDYSIFDEYVDIDTLVITAGFGKLSLFNDIDESLIKRSFDINTVAPIRIIKHFYDKLLGSKPFYCGVMVSIAGFMSSPFFSVYSATKAALKIFIESVNVEIEKSNSINRILNVSPGSIKGTTFNNGINDLSLTSSLAREIITKLELQEDLFIPQYEEIFKEVLSRYHNDFREEGRHSYDYKVNSGRIK